MIISNCQLVAHAIEKEEQQSHRVQVPLSRGTLIYELLVNQESGKKHKILGVHRLRLQQVSSSQLANRIVE